jgi:hypothetical protein
VASSQRTLQHLIAERREVVFKEILAATRTLAIGALIGATRLAWRHPGTIHGAETQEVAGGHTGGHELAVGRQLPRPALQTEPIHERQQQRAVAGKADGG